MTQLKSWLLRLLLLSFGLIVPLFMLELGVRMVGLAPPAIPNPAIWESHPLFGWWHIPDSGGRFYSSYNEFSAEVHINARGLRDREIGYDNPDHAFRVLSLADSFGEALQVELEATYHKQLETRLAQTLAQPVEVINAGVGGWGTDQQAIFYAAEGFRYQPDVVLLAFFVRNDVVNNYKPLELARNGGSQQKQFFELRPDGTLLLPTPAESDLNDDTESGDAAADSEDVAETTDESAEPSLLWLADLLWEYSALYRFLLPHIRDMPNMVQWLGPSGILSGEGVVRANHPATPIPFFVYQNPPDDQFEAAWQLTEAIIRRLRDEVAQRGSTLAVVLVSAPEQLDPAAWETMLSRHPTMQQGDWNLALPNQRLGPFLEREGIPYLDLLPVFREAAAQPQAEPLHFQHDQHWTTAGHQVAAAAIEQFLIEAVIGE